MSLICFDSIGLHTVTCRQNIHQHRLFNIVLDGTETTYEVYEQNGGPGKGAALSGTSDM
jgi:hypothetical protein